MIAPSTVNKLQAIKFFTPINLFYYVGQNLTFFSGKTEINEIVQNVLKKQVFPLFTRVLIFFLFWRNLLFSSYVAWYVGTHESLISIMYTHVWSLTLLFWDTINGFMMGECSRLLLMFLNKCLYK